MLWGSMASWKIVFYKDQLQRITTMEGCVAGIKDNVEVSRLQLKEEIDDIKGTLKTITEVLIDDHNAAVSKNQQTNDVADLKGSFETISARMATLEANSNSLTEEMENLKRVLSECISTSSDSSSTAPISNQRFEDLEVVIRDMGKQLEDINQHVCPRVNPIPIHIPSEDEGQIDEESDQEPPAMTPNTLSAHYVPPQQSVPQCEPYNLYAENVVPADVRTRVLEFVSDPTNCFTTVGGSRDVLYFGEYGYGYSGAKHSAKDTPLVIQELLDSIRPHLPESNAWLNSCLITRYKGGASHIPLHSDNEPSIDPTSVIVTASIGTERVISFHSTSTSSEVKSLSLKDSSIYVMTRYSQDFWQHGINEEDNPDNGDENVRYSFTFRHVAPHFLNSTVIIGDSNTKYIKFGKGIGTLGKWVPGRRVQAAKIEHIPPPQEIGPYRNIILHTGINNLTEERRPSNRALMAHLKRKCGDIQAVYPNSKLYVSLVLPTKSKFVNNRVNELNNMIT